MNERRRFLVALSGLAGSLGLAAGIALTGPVRLSLPPIAAAPPAAMAAPLPALPVRAWAPSRRARPVPREPAAGAAHPLRALASVHVPLNARTQEPALERDQRQHVTPALLRGRTLEAALAARAPAAVAAAPTAQADAAPHRGAVSGGVVAAGHHMSAGFRTVGRTLRRLF